MAAPGFCSHVRQGTVPLSMDKHRTLRRADADRKSESVWLTPCLVQARSRVAFAIDFSRRGDVAQTSHQCDADRVDASWGT